MKTKTKAQTTAIAINSVNTTKPFIVSLFIAALLALLFVEVTDRVDTGIDYALFTQQSYTIHLG